MKLNHTRRAASAVAALAVTFSLAACGSDDSDSQDDSSAGQESSSATEESSDSEMGSEMDSEMTDEMTDDMTDSEMEGESSSGQDGQFDAVFGPACESLPADGEPGSLTGMVSDPVATAAGTNPLLTQLVGAIGSVDGLAGTLNDAPALTVFAPTDDAFGALPPKQVKGLMDGAKKDGAKSDLATILSHHVVGENLDPMKVAGEQPTLIGDNLTVSGDPESGMTVSDGTVEAKVLCGGIPTANATVYVIDSVLTGAKPAA